MGVLCLIYMILALRTNAVFVMIFFTLVFAFCFLAAAHWQMANGATSDLPKRLIVAGGAFAFVTCMCGWWIFFAIMLASLDFPFQLPGESRPILKLSSMMRVILLVLPVQHLVPVHRDSEVYVTELLTIRPCSWRFISPHQRR